MMALLRQCQNDIIKLAHRIQLVIGRGRTSTAVIDSDVVRRAQANLGYNQTKDNLPVVQHYGLASNPPPGTDIIVAFINGDRSNGVAIAENNQTYALKNLGNGAVALYDMFGNTVVLSSTGIAITSAISLSITAAQNLTLTGENIVIHATQSLKYDADGNGTEFTSNTRNDYVTGSTNTSHNLNPPQVP